MKVAFALMIVALAVQWCLLIVLGFTEGHWWLVAPGLIGLCTDAMAAIWLTRLVRWPE